MHIRRALGPAVLMILFSALLTAEERLDLRWRDLDSAITGKRVWLPMNTGVRISGTIGEVQPTGLRMDVRSTSDPKTYPKGPVSIPRAAVSTVLLRKPVGHKGLIVGAIVGGGIGAMAVSTYAVIAHNEGGDAFNGNIASATITPIAIGVLSGWLFDAVARHRQKRIVIRAD